MAAKLAPPVDMLARLRQTLTEARRYDIGFPGATDLSFPDLAEFFTGQLLNNIGDPWIGGHGRNHTKDVEREVIDIVGGWLGAPDSRWGYVTTGASEGTLHALDEAWQAFQGDAVVYTSAAAHYSVAKAARLLRMPLVMLRTDERGRLDTGDLEAELRLRRHRAAVVVATAGTTMTEAVDDVAAIVEVCDRLAVMRRRVHVDAALSAIPLALLPGAQRPAFDFTAGATSLVTSGHKFLGTLMPCGILIYHTSPYAVAAARPSYVGSPDTTITGSRSGHTPLLLWHVLTSLGATGLRARAQAAWEMAAYTCTRLNALGIPATRNPWAFTVVMPTPAQQVRDKWVLADDGVWSHIITMPGIDRDQIDEFIGDVEVTMTGRPDTPAAPINGRRPPRQSKRATHVAALAAGANP